MFSTQPGLGRPSGGCRFGPGFWVCRPAYLIILILLILQPLLPVVSEAVEGNGSSVSPAVVLGVFVPLQQWRDGPFLLHGIFKFPQHPLWQHRHGDVVEEPLADGMCTRWPCMTIKHAKQNTTRAWQASGTAPTVLTWMVGWKGVAMETQDSMGGRASGEGVVVFTSLESEHHHDGVGISSTLIAASFSPLKLG